jgi:hypothetical protein
MKFILLCCCFVAFILLSFTKIPVHLSPGNIPGKDTIPAVHITDGLTKEWPVDKFRPDNDTTIFTAVDRDGENLYVVLSIPDFSMQSKLMRNGMKLCIDLKGKKKENRGIEFPISEEVNTFIKAAYPEPAPGSQQSGTGNERPKKEFDKKAARNIMSLGMTAAKLFGMSTESSDEQGLTMPGSVNIAFKWDATDEMHIEYSIPFKLLNVSANDQKEISVGWKVNGMQRPVMGQAGYDERIQGRMSPNTIGFNNAPGRQQRQMSMAELMKEQSFWTSYMIQKNQ